MTTRETILNFALNIEQKVSKEQQKGFRGLIKAYPEITIWMLRGQEYLREQTEYKHQRKLVRDMQEFGLIGESPIPPEPKLFEELCYLLCRGIQKGSFTKKEYERLKSLAKVFNN